jgi:hypothetical protein
VTDVQRSVERSTVHDVLRGPGRPIDTALRQEMEARLDAEFSDVRLHTGATARRSATQIGARAYSSGNNIVIGDGGTDKHTLAHELTHVIQQRQGPVAGTDNGNGLAISSPDDHFEREAEKSAHKALSGPARKNHPDENVVERASAGPAGGTGDPAMIVQRATAASPGTIIQRARYKRDENGQLVSDGQGGFVMEEEQASDRISAVLRPGEAPQPMTETKAKEWLRRGVDEETRKRYDGKTSVIAAFLQAPGPSVQYGADDRERFYRDLVTFSGQQVYEEQLEVLNAVARLAFLIGKEYSARQFAYVGLGRSPAPLIAQLDKLHPGNTWHLPLSSFRAGTGEADNIINPALQTPNQMTGAVTPNAAPDVGHQRMLVKHFDEFFRARPLRGKDVLLIDYGQTSTSLVSAQFHLQQYVMHRLKSPAAVHALALHEDRHAGAIQSLRNLVTKPEKNVPPYHPLALIDRFTSAVTGKAPASDEVDRRNVARGEWDERFESFNLGGAPGNEANEPYLKVGKAFSAERFDAYSPYGSFPILDKSQEEFGQTRPRRNRRNDAYDVLSEEIDNAAF